MEEEKYQRAVKLKKSSKEKKKQAKIKKQTKVSNTALIDARHTFSGSLPSHRDFTAYEGSSFCQ